MTRGPGKIAWQSKDNTMELYVPVNGNGDAMGFWRVRCRQCGNADLDVSLTGEGWCVECHECDGSASMLDAFPTSGP